MLIIKAEMMFFNPIKNSSIKDGISAKATIRPAFNFGEELLFSGTVESDSECEMYLYQNVYVVKVTFPTIEGEAYEAVKPLIKIGMNLDIQNGSRVIGKAKLLDYEFKK
jgi:hypothetical protein